MKRCPMCQRAYADDNLAYCLDDGSPLFSAAPETFEAPPTVKIPAPRLTNHAPQPSPPVYQQPGSTGFQFNNRAIGITGASLLTIGIFMPLISLLGLIGFSYIQLAQMSASFFTGYLLAVLGIGSLVLALKGQYKPLIATGIAALAILVIDFFRIRSAIASGIPLPFPGATPSADSTMMGQAIQSVIQISWGFFAMAAGAILLIVAGTKKDKTAAYSTDWSRNPPPPMNYS